MKINLNFIYLALVLLAFASCQDKAQEKTSNPGPETHIISQENTAVITSDSFPDQDTLPERVQIMVIPCSNGYLYNTTIGDLNISLVKYLQEDDRIVLAPFPYKKMQGSGYFGVFDKKYCAKILEKTDVDFLIMTRMKGLEFERSTADNHHWGYDTKILDVKNMSQFNGISARDLTSFESIDADIKSKIDQLIDMIINARNE